MKFVFIVLAVTSLLATNSAFADQKLAQSSGCMTCHAVDKKLIGPGFKEIAAKYKADKAAEAKLTHKVKAGGSGAWGSIPMPSNPHVKENDIKTLVRWILSQ